MTEKARPPAATDDAHDDAEPRLGGEVVRDPLGPADLSLPAQYGPDDLPARLHGGKP